MKMPCLQSNKLALPIDTTVFHGALFADVSVVAQPLFAQHSAQRSEKTASEAGVQEALDPYRHPTWATELWKNDWFIECGTILEGPNYHHEEGLRR